MILNAVAFFIITLTIFAGCTDSNQPANPSQAMDTPIITPTVWSSVNGTTWWKDNDWAGETYVFYTDNHGAKKCIRQINGSGVYVTWREFVDLEIIGGTTVRINNLVYELKNDRLISEGTAMNLHSKTPLVYNRTCGPLDMEFVKGDGFVVENIDRECEGEKR
jgi:hypothetical protein